MRRVAALLVAVLPLPAVAQPNPPQTTSLPCELHVYPAGNELARVQGAMSLMGLPFMVIDSASHEGATARVKDRMEVDLPPASQVEVLTNSATLAALKLPENTIVVGESAIPSRSQLQSDPAEKARLAAMNAAIHQMRRLTTSTTPCYAELIAANLFVERDPLTNTRVRVLWYYRNLGAVPDLERDYRGWADAPAPGYTAKLAEQAEPAALTLRRAFLASLTNWAAKYLGKHPQPERRPPNSPAH